MNEQFLILSLKWSRGDFWVWWGPNECGYVTNMDRAGRYSREEVAKICGHPRSETLPVAEGMAFGFETSTVLVMHQSDLEMMKVAAKAQFGAKEGA